MNIIENRLLLIEQAYFNWCNSLDENGYQLKELDYEVYLVLNNGKTFNFTFSNLILINFSEKEISFFIAHKPIKIKFSELRDATYL